MAGTQHGTGTSRGQGFTVRDVITKRQIGETHATLDEAQRAAITLSQAALSTLAVYDRDGREVGYAYHGQWVTLADGV